MTMMACINGVGLALPPMSVVNGKTNSCPNSFETSEDIKTPCSHINQLFGWRTLGVEWFQGVFLKHCGTHRPQLLIWDSLGSHETLDVILKAKENGIIMSTFPPTQLTSSVHLIDGTIFGPFRKAFQNFIKIHFNLKRND